MLDRGGKERFRIETLLGVKFVRILLLKKEGRKSADIRCLAPASTLDPRNVPRQLDHKCERELASMSKERENIFRRRRLEGNRGAGEL
jgi:hypothetical protein